MSVDLIVEAGDWAVLPLEELATDVLSLVARTQNLENPTLSILACDDTRIAELNTEFRGKPVPTNVLSWPVVEIERDARGQPEAMDFEDGELGDIAIAFETCSREAETQSKSLEAHVTHLILHGTLHLLGYDHETDQDATVMEKLETELLAKLGYDDPYSLP